MYVQNTHILSLRCPNTNQLCCRDQDIITGGLRGNGWALVRLGCSHDGLILCLVKVKTLCHPHSDNQQSLYIIPDNKKTNERGGELQRGLVKEVKSKERGITWFYVETEFRHVVRPQVLAPSDVMDFIQRFI